MKRAACTILFFLLILSILSACQIAVENEKLSTSPVAVEPSPLVTNHAGRTQTIETRASPSASPNPTGTSRVLPTIAPTDDLTQPSINTPVIEYSSPRLIECLLDGCIYSAFQSLQYPIPPEYAPYVEKTYRYGSTQNGSRESHSGVEIPAALGTPVIAAADGTVFYAGDDQTTQFGRYKEFYGNLVILEHHFSGLDEPVYTLYAHLSRILVQTGDSITTGQQIGNVGNSGATSGAHLHFEVRRGAPDLSNIVNPELWLVPLEIQPDPEEKLTEIAGTLIVRLTEGGMPVASRPVKLEAYDDLRENKLFYIDAESYALDIPSNSDWKESLGVGGLLPGLYRISVVFDNHIYEKWVKISSELITLVEFDFAE